MIALRAVDRAFWLDVVRAAPQATFFHTPYWADVAAATGGWEPATLGGELADGARVVYPLVRQSRRVLPALGRLQSAWAGCYGGPVAERRLEAGEADALHAAVRARAGAEVQVVVAPGSPWPRGQGTQADSTLVVDLAGGFDAALARFTQGHRRAYRRGLREGLVVRRGGVDDVAAYVEMYAATLARWGDRATSRYPAALFERLGALGAEHPDAVALWLAEHDGELCAGVWALSWHGHVVLWHGAARPDDRPMVSAQTTLYGEVIRHAALSGQTCVDFNPSGGHAGAEAFKRRFGTREAPVGRVRLCSRRAALAGQALGIAQRARTRAGKAAA